jgi:Flp pilus assembly pilin Flp
MDVDTMIYLAKKSSSKLVQRGASLVEYALLVGLIAIAAIAAMQAFGTKMSQQFSNISRLL